MEKLTAHYALAEILLQMQSVEDLNLSVSASTGIRMCGLSNREALAIVRALTRKNFYKSMTTHADHRVWQDVYHGHFQGIVLYIKFQKIENFFVISFKEL